MSVDAVEEQCAGRRAVVAGHAEFAVGLISAVQQISGMGAALVPLSSVGLAGVDITAVLAATVDRIGTSVVFTDLPAGSCTIAARRLQRARPELVLVTGVNLATALEFVFRSADESPLEAARAAAEKGRATLLVHGGGL
ncbi:MAG: hypothetical protein M3Y64_04305 [Gemmatimonadota bacterium]|nr:hypothetical protein [Gemmatimonadota bacterium]